MPFRAVEAFRTTAPPAPSDKGRPAGPEVEPRRLGQPEVRLGIVGQSDLASLAWKSPSHIGISLSEVSAQ